MHKKYLFFIFGLILVRLLFTPCQEASCDDIWVVKSKNPVFTIWMSGKITRGEPSGSTSGSSQIVTLSGNQYISANRWFSNGNAMYCPWAGKPIIYKIDSEGSNYRIGLSAKNFASRNPAWTKPSGYSHFEVDVYAGGHYQGRLTIEASDTQVNTAYLDDVVNIGAGLQEVKFIWRNDRYNLSAKQDANIEIHSVLFEKIG